MTLGQWAKQHRIPLHRRHHGDYLYKRSLLSDVALYWARRLTDARIVTTGRNPRVVVFRPYRQEGTYARQD